MAISLEDKAIVDEVWEKLLRSFGIQNGTQSFVFSGAMESSTGGSGTFSSVTLTGGINGMSVNSATAVGIILNSGNSLTTAGAKLLSVRNNGVEKIYVDKDGDVVAARLFVGGSTTSGMGQSASTALLYAPNAGDLKIQNSSTGTVWATINETAAMFPGTVATAGLLPNANNTHDLGSGALLWRDGFFGRNVAVNGTLSAASGQFNVASGSGKITLNSTDSSGTPGAVTINKPSGQVSVAAGTNAVVVTNSIVTAASIVIAVAQQSDGTGAFVNRVLPAAGSFTIIMSANVTNATKVGFVVFN